MKLVEILAKELKEWPDCAEFLVQDIEGVHKGKVLGFSGMPYSDFGVRWAAANGWSVGPFNVANEASDA